MRKILFSLFLLLGGFLLLSGYDVAVLSDTHYDSPELRRQIPRRIKENSIRRNWRAWRKNMPGFLELYRTKAAKTDFVIHCGDLAHGFFSETDDTAQIAAVKKGIAVFAEGIPGKFYCVKGNHENLCVDPAASSDKVIAEHLNGIGIIPEKLNYSLVHQGDLYVFFDSNNPDVDFVRRTLEAHPDSRYTFFVTHFPVLPCCSANPGWIVLKKADQQTRLRELISLLAKRNAVILCGHIHRTTLVRALYPEGSLTQLSVFSLPVFNAQGRTEEPEPEEYLNGVSEKGNFLPPHLKNLFCGHYLKYVRYSPSCGLHLLRITGSRIVMLEYNLNGKLVHSVIIKQ